MSFAGSFQAIAARYGQTVTLWRDGEIVGTGRAVLRPLLGEARQFVPTDLGLRRQEMVLCLAEASLPLEEQPGDWVLQQGERFYGVRRLAQGGLEGAEDAGGGGTGQGGGGRRVRLSELSGADL